MASSSVDAPDQTEEPGADEPQLQKPTLPKKPTKPDQRKGTDVAKAARMDAYRTALQQYEQQKQHYDEVLFPAYRAAQKAQHEDGRKRQRQQTPKQRGAPRVLTDEEREAAAERHKLAKRQHSRIRTIVHHRIRKELQCAADVRREELRAARRIAAAPAQAPPHVPAPRDRWACDMCQHIMTWQIPQRCTHCRIKSGDMSSNAWYDSTMHWWGPFDEHGICICNCCKGTCSCAPCVRRRAEHPPTPGPARAASPASPHGECDGETEREIENGYDDQLPAYADDDWRAQQTTAPVSDPYEYIPEYADVCI